MIKAEIEGEAKKVRNKLGLTAGPIDENELRTILENKRHYLFYYPFGMNSLSGASCQHNDSKVIIINSSQTLGRQNFTLCHELAHLYLHKFTEHIDNISAVKDKIEKEADTFASAFLMPHDEVIQFLHEIDSKDIDIITVMKVSSYFRISFQAALVRMKQVMNKKKIPEKLLNASPKHTAKLFNLSGELYESTREKYWTSTKYMTLAYKALEEEKISVGKFLELLKIIGIDGYEVIDKLKGYD